MKSRMRKTHMGPFGMILSMVDTSRGHAPVCNWRYLVSIGIVALAALWLFAAHIG
jgi:hypothetical protein